MHYWLRPSPNVSLKLSMAWIKSHLFRSLGSYRTSSESKNRAGSTLTASRLNHKLVSKNDFRKVSIVLTYSVYHVTK